MFLHLGQSTVVTFDEIIGIFDLDTTTVQKATRDYLALAEKSGRVINVSSFDLPKSFVVCKAKRGKKEKKGPLPNVVYISPISSATLLKRIGYSIEK